MALLVGCHGHSGTPTATGATSETPTIDAGVTVMQLTSSAFRDGGTIPPEYTADGKNLSPPLKWDGAPVNTKSFALICDDPDAPRGVWVHWVLFNVRAETHELLAGAAGDPAALAGARQGTNSFDKTGYGGPAPPKGPAHRYFFKLHALDMVLGLPGAADKEQLLDAMKGHILAEGLLMGKYGR
jgi:Raf kinase inhibitor-like YbhB/YbcL family protein